MILLALGKLGIEKGRGSGAGGGRRPANMRNKPALRQVEAKLDGELALVLLDHANRVVDVRPNLNSEIGHKRNAFRKTLWFQYPYYESEIVWC